ncbi:regulator [Streptomyces sp. NPDC059092]|uniref:regulator n=1 Tax=Streptomyces sp. NPDC059092 TaxID=3346725 RepID=UPI0036991E2B
MSERPPQRTPNRQLAALIAEAGFSHAGLARRVDQLGLEHGLDLRYDKTSVTRWLRGQQPRGTTPALIAEVFTRRLGRRLSAQDLGLDACAPVYAGLEFASTPEEAVDIVGGLWRKDSGSHNELRKIAFTPAGLVVPSRDWLIGRADERVAHPGLAAAGPGGPAGSGPALPAGPVPSAGPGGLAGTAGSVTSVGAAPGRASGLVPQRPGRGPGSTRVPAQAQAHAPGRPSSPAPGSAPSPVPAARFSPPVPSSVPRPRTERAVGQRVTAGDIEALRSVGDLFRTLDHAYGGGHARQALVRYLEHEAEPMLRGLYGETTGRRLFAAAADLTRLAGWTSYDIAAHGLAQRYFVQALRLSQAAGDRVYGSYVLITMSRQAVYLGHGREAVQLARVAQQGVGGSAPPVVQALLHSAEARGHGVLAEARACAASLLRAERALDAARPGDETPSWARFFDEAQFADELAHCHRDLQQYRVSVQHAERSLQLRAPEYARSRLFCRVVLACGRLGLGELDQACLLGVEAAQQASEMRSARAAEYVRDFERRLEPYRDAAAVRNYRDRVAAIG